MRMGPRTVLWAGLALCLAAGAARAATDIAQFVRPVRPAAIEKTIEDLSALGSRVAGYPGADQAARYVLNQFRTLGLRNVRTQAFPVTVPVTRHAWVRVRAGGVDRRLDIYPLWPNRVRTCQTPPAGLTGPLVDGKSGEFTDLNGHEIAGSILIVDFNSETRWFNGPLLGAQAVLFPEPDSVSRGEAESKFLSPPASMPRFWVKKDDARWLRELVAREDNVSATVCADVRWERRTAYNILGEVLGTNAEYAKERLVLESYYDSMSVVPDLAPGAESACGIAALLEIARCFAQSPPERSILFLATSAHFEALGGTREFLRLHREAGWSTPYNASIPAADSSVQVRVHLNPEGEKPLPGTGDTGDANPAAGTKYPTVSLRLGAGAMIKPGQDTLTIRSKLADAPFSATISLTDPAGWEREDEFGRWVKAEQAPAAVDNRLSGDAIQYRYMTEWSGAPELLGSRDFKVTPALDFEEASAPGDDAKPPKITAFISIDLSSRSDLMCVFYKGHFYNMNEAQQWKYSDFGKSCTTFAGQVESALGISASAHFADAINSITGSNWKSYLPCRLAMDFEQAAVASEVAVGFATANDMRALVDTPMDVAESVDTGSVTLQTRLLAGLLHAMLAKGTTGDKSDPADLGGLDFARKTKPLTLDADLWCVIDGNIVYFDPTQDYYPNEPVPGAIAFARGPAKTSAGVRGDILQMVGHDGRFTFHGVPMSKIAYYGFGMEGFLLRPEDGEIIMAPDLGQSGAQAFPIDQVPDAQQKTIRVVVFPCKAMSLYDLVDQRQFMFLNTVSVLNAVSNASPFSWGMSLPEPSRQWQSYLEPVAVVYGKSGEQLKFGFGLSVLGNRFLLLNGTRDDPMGKGYDLGQNPILYPLPRRVAEDMWYLNESRIETLRGYGIKNKRMEELHAGAWEALAQADAARKALRYDEFFRYLREALGYETKVYPDVMKTTMDVVKGVIFYLALLLPFSFFCERLFFASMTMGRQILGCAVFFLAIFCVLWVVHPAFQITRAPLIVLLAFVMMTLTLLVTYIIVTKFDQRMRFLKQQVTGLRETDVGRLSASSAAFSLGVANMRRRRLRSTLTSVTLILLTFTLMSFTSVVSETRYNRIKVDDHGRYYGLQIRDRQWNPISLPALRFMRNEYGDRYPVAPRAWYLSEMVGNISRVGLTYEGKRIEAAALVGLTPAEESITMPGESLVAGRWFSDQDQGLTCILPAPLAKIFGLTEADIDRAEITILGSRCKLIGIIDPLRFQQCVDIDGEPLTPVDYQMMAQKQRTGDAAAQDQVLNEYIHYNPNQVVLVPFQFALDAGASLRSIAVNIGDPDAIDEEVESLLKRVELNMYTRGKRSLLVSAVATSGLQAASQGILIPLLIASLIVLNTMLGAVYERLQEIGIFSSLGLAPMHIAFLFVAEALVYAVLGAVMGYLVGQMVAKGVVAFGWFPELSLNYSSVAGAGTAVVVMITVLASTLYPARMAGRLATPGIDRRWKLVDPQEGVFEVELPFSSSTDQVLGLNAFLYEYLGAHVEYSTGKFSADNVDLVREGDVDAGPRYHLASTVWIAPYDLGVRERFTLVSAPVEDQEGAYGFVAIIRREDGDEGAWIRLTRNFLTVLRQQFLLWRTFDAVSRAEYAVKGYTILGEVPPAGLVAFVEAAKTRDEDESAAPAAAEEAPVG